MTASSRQPLKWCVDWDNLGPLQRFVLTFSDWFGIRKKAYADLSRQLRARSETDLGAWSAYPEDVKELAGSVSGVLKDYLEWPTDIFLPDDPAEIPFWDHTGDLAGVEAIMAVEKFLGIELDEAFVDRLSSSNYGEVIAEMARKLAEQRPAPDG